MANCREENNHLCDEYEKYNNQVFVAESATFRVSFPDADAKEEREYFSMDISFLLSTISPITITNLDQMWVSRFLSHIGKMKLYPQTWVNGFWSWFTPHGDVACFSTLPVAPGYNNYLGTFLSQQKTKLMYNVQECSFLQPWAFAMQTVSS